jgi:hypothetical protein
MFGIFGRNVTKYTVIYGVHIRCTCTVLANFRYVGGGAHNVHPSEPLVCLSCRTMSLHLQAITSLYGHAVLSTELDGVMSIAQKRKERRTNTHLLLAWTIYKGDRFLFCTSFMLRGRETTKCTVIYGVYVRFWPTLRIRRMTHPCFKVCVCV